MLRYVYDTQLEEYLVLLDDIILYFFDTEKECIEFIERYNKGVEIK